MYSIIMQRIYFRQRMDASRAYKKIASSIVGKEHDSKFHEKSQGYFGFLIN